MESITKALKECLGETAEARPGQIEAINEIVNNRKKVLVVQKTGWGKSIVYFVATKLLRLEGSGPTLVISPLIALMRNQELYGKRLGINVRHITHANSDEHEEIIEELIDENIDLLLISPERLSNEEFMKTSETVFKKAGLLVIDEAHCISDWGHDFRPDYRRLINVIKQLPPRIPVLATTATANDRVIEDIREQIGSELEIKRGTLERDSLHLKVFKDFSSYAERLSIITQIIKATPGTGIVYCLTVRDTEIVTSWLKNQKINAKAYSGQADKNLRLEIEEELIKNEVKVVIATSALGMGFDKPDLSFVIHFQCPPSPAAYYQQVGRAGRNIDKSIGVLLYKKTDEEIWEYFDKNSIFESWEIKGVLNYLKETANTGAKKLTDIEKNINISEGRLEKLIKKLEVEGHLFRENNQYSLTPKKWVEKFYDIEDLVIDKNKEHEDMRNYLFSNQCRMKLLRNYLDDKTNENCQKCDNCLNEKNFKVESVLVEEANKFLNKRSFPINPRKKWLMNNSLVPIPENLQIEVGIAKSLMSSNLGVAIRECKNKNMDFPDYFVDKMCEVIDEFPSSIKPKYITYVPSNKVERNQVKNIVYKIAEKANLIVLECLKKVKSNNPQKLQNNSYYQSQNIKDAFQVINNIPSEPIYLFDDIVDSKWTMTYLGALLRKNGAERVFPIALVVSGSS